jgi:hypothetical protein
LSHRSFVISEDHAHAVARGVARGVAEAFAQFKGPTGGTFVVNEESITSKILDGIRSVSTLVDSRASFIERAKQSAGLAPCPFCGSGDIDPRQWSSEDGQFGPGCMDCGALADSAEKWNRRMAKGEGG